MPYITAFLLCPVYQLRVSVAAENQHEQKRTESQEARQVRLEQPMSGKVPVHEKPCLHSRRVKLEMNNEKVLGNWNIPHIAEKSG